MKTTIADRYYNELKNQGHTVPRNIKTGDTLNYRVGGIYMVQSDDKTIKEQIRAKCTQNCPCALVKY